MKHLQLFIVALLFAFSAFNTVFAGGFDVGIEVTNDEGDSSPSSGSETRDLPGQSDMAAMSISLSIKDSPEYKKMAARGLEIDQIMNLVENDAEIVAAQNRVIPLLRAAVKRRDRVRDQVLGMDFPAVRTEYVTAATGALETSRSYYLQNEFKRGLIAANVAETFLDLATSLTPGISWGRDLYEAISGDNLVTGDRLQTLERAFAVFGVLTAGIGSKIGVTAKLLRRLMKGRKQAAALKMASTLINASRRVIPKFGNKFVNALPDLVGTEKAAFHGGILKGFYQPGDILYQAQNNGQDYLGNWFSTLRPLSIDHGEEMLNIAKWGKRAEKVKTFIVKERVSGYAGKVDGGSGYQFFIPHGTPLDDVLKEVAF